MKYVVALIAGLLCGAVIFALGLYMNPFVGSATVSPLAVAKERVVDLSFSAVPDNGLLFTDSGDSIIDRHPERVALLWEPAIAGTRLFVTMLENSRGDIAGVGIKLLSKSERTSLIRGEALAESTWHVYLPGQGTLLIDQTENYWSYIRDVVVPARRSSADSWRGSFHRITTHGPGALGTARVTGGSGAFAGMTSEAVESLTATGYSAATGPAAMRGSLTIAIPDGVVARQQD